MIKNLPISLGIIFFLVGQSPAADLLYDNGNHINEGAESNIPDGYRHADDFILSTSAVITQLSWKGFYSGTPTDDIFEVFIYADNGMGEPTSPVTTSAIYSTSPVVTAKQQTGETFGIGGAPIYQYSANMPAFNAVGGARYWLEIFNNVNEHWDWSCDVQAGNGFYSFEGSDWTKDNISLFATTFQLSGTVPEPSTLTLLGLGSLSLLVRRRLGH